MAKILLCWELGGGLGHLANLQPLARRLRARGHDVALALAEIGNASRLLPGFAVFQAPRRPAGGAGQPMRETRSYGELLLETGTGDATTLASITTSWRSLFDALSPDLLILDHAPYALLAARGLGSRTMLIGTGFFCPPPWDDYLDLSPWARTYPDRLRLADDAALDALNGCLATLAAPPLARLSELWESVDGRCLTSFPELDHFPDRGPASFAGVWPIDMADGGAKPAWPDGDGPRVFAYLKPYGDLVRILQNLSRDHRMLAFVPGLEPEQAVKMSRPGATVSRQPIAMSVALEADVAVNNMGHHSAVEFLLAGKPVVAVPLTGEQRLLGLALERTGAGISVSKGDAPAVAEAVRRVLAEPSFRAAAETFADRNRGCYGEAALDHAVRSVEAILERKEARA